MADGDDLPRYRLHARDGLRAEYANFADVTLSEYEVTLTFAHVDRTPVEGGAESAGMVVSQLVLSPRFAAEMADALDAAVDRYERQYGRPDASPSP
ncbi:MAG: DUF3467 domain-containing protein [Patulibacter minatonensis]